MMASHLTPLVFRQMLRGRALTHQQCLRLLRASHLRHRAFDPVPSAAVSRTIFSWGKSSQDAGGRKVDAGYTELARLDQLLRMKVRPLDPEVVSTALGAFFTHKHQAKRRITDEQIHLALVACNHLLGIGDKTLAVSPDKLVLALKSLRIRGTVQSAETAELARIFYRQLEISKTELAFKDSDRTFETEVVLPYVQVLCNCGEGKEARDVLDIALESNPEPFRNSQFWEPVLNVFIANRDDTEMNYTLKTMETHKVPLGPELQLSVLGAFAQQGDFLAAQQWHDALVRKFPTKTVSADAIFLDLCIKHKKLIDGEAAFRRLLNTEPDKAAWDIILRWAAAKGKGVDEVERMMDVMIKRQKELNTPGQPDVDTINGLISLASSMNDPYQAERYVALATKRGIYLNGKTFALQMEYRLDVGDLQGAYKAFQNTISEEVHDSSDLPQINRLVQKLCSAPDPENAQIYECLRTLDERRCSYEPETIVALCRLRLAQNKIRPLITMLHAHAYNLSRDQRRPIMDVFLGYILDRDNAAKDAWDAYCILREVFSELDNAARTQIMIDFFARGRSDIAIHVFGHMRQAEIMENRPSTETYALCFQGVGHAADEHSFDLVYNMLKLDSKIEPDTHLRNAIMLAQIGCGFRARALEVWDDIVFSREGPTYNSIAIALYAVETKPEMTDKGHEIWNRLVNYNVQLTKQIYIGYIGALAGQDQLEEAFEKVDGMQAAVGEQPDATTLGVLYNAAFTEQKRQVQTWASQKYPSAWSALQALGMTEKGLYKINRQLTP